MTAHKSNKFCAAPGVANNYYVSAVAETCLVFTTPSRIFWKELPAYKKAFWENMICNLHRTTLAKISKVYPVCRACLAYGEQSPELTVYAPSNGIL